MVKKYSTAPLPFRGSKRYFAKSFRSALQDIKDIDIIVDLFGGSGLLARVAKDTLPQCKVIYNDYDHYVDRLALIPHTNALLRSIAPLVVTIPENKKIPAEVKEKVLQVIKTAEQHTTVDYTTLSASILFSGNWSESFEDLAKQTMYNRLVKTPYNAEGYLTDIEVTHEDYTTIYDAYKDQKRVLFVLDPPYLQTDCKTYKDGVYWSLKDYLNVLNLLQDNKYILFTSGKSDVIELCQWLNITYKAGLLKGCRKHERINRVNNFAPYKDIMLERV